MFTVESLPSIFVPTTKYFVPTTSGWHGRLDILFQVNSHLLTELTEPLNLELSSKITWKANMYIFIRWSVNETNEKIIAEKTRWDVEMWRHGIQWHSWLLHIFLFHDVHSHVTHSWQKYSTSFLKLLPNIAEQITIYWNRKVHYIYLYVFFLIHFIMWIVIISFFESINDLNWVSVMLQHATDSYCTRENILQYAVNLTALWK